MGARISPRLFLRLAVLGGRVNRADNKGSARGGLRIWHPPGRQHGAQEQCGQRKMDGDMAKALHGGKFLGPGQGVKAAHCRAQTKTPPFPAGSRKSSKSRTLCYGISPVCLSLALRVAAPFQGPVGSARGGAGSYRRWSFFHFRKPPFTLDTSRPQAFADARGSWRRGFLTPQELPVTQPASERWGAGCGLRTLTSRRLTVLRRLN